MHTYIHTYLHGPGRAPARNPAPPHLPTGPDTSRLSLKFGSFHSSAPSKSQPHSVSHMDNLNRQATLIGTKCGGVPFKQAWAKDDMKPTMVSPEYVLKNFGLMKSAWSGI